MSQALFEKRDALMTEFSDLEGKSDQDSIDRRNAIAAECKGIDARVRGYFEGKSDGSVSASGGKSLGQHVIESRGEALAGLSDLGPGATVVAPEFKAATDTVETGGPAGTAPDPLGVLLTDVDTTIVKPKRERPVIADLLGVGSVTGNAISYFVEGAEYGDFDTVAEGAQKPQMSFGAPTAKIDPIRKIAGWVKVTDEFLEDLPALKSEIDQRLLHKLSMREEAQLLRGDGTGQNIEGLLNRDGVQVLDVSSAEALADGIFQATTRISTATDLAADGLIINPIDYEALRLSKDGNDQYFGGGFFQGPYGNGAMLDTPPVWGLRTVVSPVAAVGRPIVGNFRLGATLYRKGGIQVAATNSHEDDFTNNKVTIRVEERIGLAVRVPSAFVKLEVAGGGDGSGE